MSDSGLVSACDFGFGRGLQFKTTPFITQVNVTVILTYGPASTITDLWIAWTCDCCSFADFLIARGLLVTKYLTKSLKNFWYILCVSSTWFNSFSVQLEPHEKNSNINVRKRTEAGAGTRTMKKESYGAVATLMKCKNSLQSHVHEKKSFGGAGAMSFSRRLRSPGLPCFDFRTWRFFTTVNNMVRFRRKNYQFQKLISYIQLKWFKKMKANKMCFRVYN